MLDKNNATFIETRRISISNKIYKVYHFNCIDCDIDIKCQSYQLRKHTGKCRRCCQKGIPYKHIYTELKNHHNKRIEFNLTFEEFLELIEIKNCHYCGEIIKFNPHTRDENHLPCSRAYQLDRKDNDIGYVKDNLVVCCWECNRLKSDRFTYKEFIKLSTILKEIMQNRNN